MTFSIAARDEKGAFGVAICSSSPAVAARCAAVRPGVGAVCSQNVTDPRLRERLLHLLELGTDAEAAVSQVAASEAHIEYRQLSAVGRDGAPVSFTGGNALGTSGAVEAANCVAAGNLLAYEGVPKAMTVAFERTAGQPMARRLLAALSAAIVDGGEEGPVHSAGLLVAHDAPWPVVDLRVDWTDGDPVSELGALLDLWEPQQDSYVQRGLNPGGAPSFGVPGDE
ncbi:DUF1028 domain-containing protein [Haloechinothrix salitolerans]|uniref:DUF1028 domain-containing protein n=1 Tax=Haloechinothrix salitolerans TaxID=926830 RepID=A0ABW2C5U4_9PSEU